MQHPEARLCVYACVCVWEGYWQRLAHLFRCSATLLVAPAGAHFHRFFLFPASFCVRMCRSVCVCVCECGLHGILSSKSHPDVCVCVCLGWSRVWLRIHFPFCQEHPARDQKYASNVKYSFVSANEAILKPVLTPDYIQALLMLLLLLLLHKLSHFVSPERAARHRSLALVSLSLSGSLRCCKSCFLREATVLPRKDVVEVLSSMEDLLFGGIVCLPTYASFLGKKNLFNQTANRYGEDLLNVWLCECTAWSKRGQKGERKRVAGTREARP